MHRHRRDGITAFDQRRGGQRQPVDKQPAQLWLVGMFDLQDEVAGMFVVTASGPGAREGGGMGLAPTAARTGSY